MRAAQGTAGGHPQITATHRKTLELSREREIGPTASCVVAVAVEIDERQIAGLRGEVELRIAAHRHSDSVRGRLNPAFRPGDPLIVRRAQAITRDAVLIGADRGAADLDRALIAALRDPGIKVAVELREVGAGASGALIVDPGPLWRACPQPAEQADLSIASPLRADELRSATQALRSGKRVFAKLDLCSDQAAVTFVQEASDASHAVLPAASLPPIAASLAVAGVPLRDLVIEQGSQRATGRLRPGCVRVAVGVRGDRVSDWLAGAERGVVSLDVATPREQHLPWRAGEELAIPGGRARTAIVVAYADHALAVADRTSASADRSAAPADRSAAPADRSAAPDDRALDPALASFAVEMLALRASTKEVAHALQRAAGLKRSVAYDAVLSLQRRAQSSSVERPEPRTRR